MKSLSLKKKIVPISTISVFGDSKFAHISSSDIRMMEQIEKNSARHFMVETINNN